MSHIENEDDFPTVDNTMPVLNALCEFQEVYIADLPKELQQTAIDVLKGLQHLNNELKKPH